MNNWIIMPAVLPAFTAAFLLLTLRHRPQAQRIVSIVATALGLLVAIGLAVEASDGVPQAYRLGDWPAPFGIVLVLDLLSATMLVLTGVLSLCVVLYAAAGWDRRGQHFHTLLQFQLLGINGAFLTGDVFNLFVFFEVMLIASYGLMLHGGGPARLKAGFHYVAINLIASALFLIGVGLIYAVTGTLNMADLAMKVPEVAPADQGLLKAGALLLFLVFATKAALVPLHWWLPATYAATSAPAAAMFMIMTKVGAYAILRVYGLVFGAEAGALALVAAPFVLPAAVVTLLLGTVGVVGSRSLRGLSAFAIVASMGTLLIALGLFDETGVSAALYYIVHSSLAGAALFLLAGLVLEGRGAVGDRLLPAPAMRGEILVGGLFLLCAVAMVGLPPLSGFLGKVMILEAVRSSAGWPWIWALILGASLALTLGFVRAGAVLFWASGPPGVGPRRRLAPLPITAIVLLLALTGAWTGAAGPAMDWMDATARQSLDRAGYVEAVLGPTNTRSAGLGE
ncbi:multisubunit potassium/proton antiporter PhaD subunit [Ancylobacter aquaticus]|uniref:Multisubunit potassium/proton antiporter PhaD subunit n=1 Tax=Ancylobacter aquaticus TaxID=100 RepID=A0A4V2PJM8_ANCAQ|nr:monovalent cation/H+ antiporter subunit D [Ancylobacter aquaticus]TCK29126.1 multisubunit potassium/proton antiporter PhaD subunit [Ancylobacter aquaticus]